MNHRAVEVRRAVHESLILHSAPEADRIRNLIAELEKAVTDEVREQLTEARAWARHGYEIGQRHCCWSDYGVAPQWLTDGWPVHFESCASVHLCGTCRDRGIVPDHSRPYDHNGEPYPKPCPECEGT